MSKAVLIIAGLFLLGMGFPARVVSHNAADQQKKAGTLEIGL